MTKLRAAGSCAEALWDTARAIGAAKLGASASLEAARAEGISEIARVLGLDLGTVRNMLNPDRPEQISLERAGLLSRAFGVDLLAQWLAQEAGGLYVPLPLPSGDIEKLTADGVRQVGAAAADIIEAVASSSDAGRALSKAEAKKIRPDVGRVIRTFEQVLAVIDRAIRRADRGGAA